MKKKGDRDIDRTLRALRPLARRLAAAQKRAAELGLFVEDRDLLTCPRCGLQEDISFDGRLMTAKPPGCRRDTGLRFSRMKRSSKRWLCPGCGAKFTGKPA